MTELEVLDWSFLEHVLPVVGGELDDDERWVVLVTVVFGSAQGSETIPFAVVDVHAQDKEDVLDNHSCVFRGVVGDVGYCAVCAGSVRW